MKVRLMKGVLATALVAGGALALAPCSAAAQTSTGTIRGYVRDAQGRPLQSVSVLARQPETNFQRTGVSTESGFFNIPGLQPGQYVLQTSLLGYAEQERPVRVLIGQTLTLDLVLSEQAIALAGIRVEAERSEETRTTEVATNITREQIENVPLVDRNFLSLATLAPGVKREGGSITSGGQSMNNVNVFVDGITFKADLLQGGVAGQDASKGNPFPQIAVQEFRVITQQYKAEYQKASSAIITATTKSGTNEWHGEVFLFGQNRDLINQDFIAVRTCTEGRAANPDFVCARQGKLDKWQGGGSFGGPLMKDRLFIFGAYEGNHQTRAFRTTLGTPANLPPADVLAQLRTHEGTHNSPFRSNLYFGKLTYTPASAHRLEASINIRDEYDIRNFGNTDSYDNAEHFNNDVNTFALRHQFASGNLLNEASVSYQSVRWHPIPLFEEQVGIRYGTGNNTVLKIGGRSTMQDFDQQRLSFRNDISYTKAGWLGDHVFKVGGNFDFLDYDIIRPLNGNPEFRFDASNSWAFPFEAVAGFGNPDLSASNEQLGVYVQDDWTPTPRLALNLGIRWDFETGMLNNDWVTPDSIRQFVAQYVTAQGFRCDGTDDPKRAQLCEADRYMTDGDDRPSFKKALQPRVGLSYDVRGDGNTVLFGGFGIYYDRNRYNVALAEYANLQWQNYTFRFSSDGLPRGGNPTMVWNPSFFSREGLQNALAQGAPARPELFLLENRTTPPNSRHFTAGVRQTLGMLQLTANYTGVRGYNILTWIRANRNVNGTCCANFPVGAPASAFKFTNVFVSSDEARSWYDAVYLKAEKRYSPSSKWGAQLSYTLAYTDEEANVSDVFSALDFFTDDFVRYTSRNDERHRITGNWIIGLPFDFRFSGLLELATPKPFNATYGFAAGTNNCTHGNRDCVGGNDWPEGKARFWWRPAGDSFLGIDGFAYRNVDLRLEKEFPTLHGQRVGLVGEVFNVFDHANFTGFNLNVGNYQSDGTILPNATFGRPTSVFTTESGGPRRYQLGLRYTF